MADSPAREEDIPPLTDEDTKLLKQLHDNPILAARLRLLVDHFEEEVAAGMDAHEAETMLIDELHQLGGSLMNQWADTTHQQRIAEAKENDPTLIRSGKKKLQWYTTFGTVLLTERVLRQGRRGAIQRPFRDSIGVTHRGCSRPLQRRIADFGAERSGRSTVEALAEHYQIDVPLYTVDKITREIAGQAYGFNLTRAPGENPAAIQVSGTDGSMVPIVDFKKVSEVAEAEKKADKRKRRVCQWKEIRVCTAHDPDRADACYGVSFGTVLEAGLMMRQTSELCGMDKHTRIHAVGDGAPWIAEAYEKQFGTQSRFLVDFYHVCEYLAEAAPNCVGNPTPVAKKKWLERQKRWLKENRAGQVLRNLERNLEDDRVANENAPVRRCWRYLKNRVDQLDYRGALEQGLPIGSGETESAHRHLIQRRLKLAGAWWSQKNAANMAQLRVTRANGLWNDFWTKNAA